MTKMSGGSPTSPRINVRLETDPTADEIAKRNPNKVLGLVKNLEHEGVLVPSPSSPVPKPRPRKEHSTDSKVTPPVSPMRRRSQETIGGKPKPPVRRRKKFNTPNSEGVSQESVDSAEQVEMECKEPEEERPVTLVRQESWQLEEEGEVEVEVQEMWIEVGEEALELASENGELTSQNSPPEEGESAESSPGSQEMASNEKADEAEGEKHRPVPSPRTARKKKPPPIPPPPYSKQPRTPPIPAKKRKRLKDSPSKSDGNLDDRQSTSTTSLPPMESEVTTNEAPPPEKPVTDKIDPIYEEVDPLPLGEIEEPEKLLSRPENLTPTLKHMSSGSFESVSVDDPGSAPPTMPSPSVSLFNTKLGGKTPPLLRGNTMGHRPILRAMSVPSKKKRAESVMLETYEVIPGVGGKLEDMMLSMREYDDRLQDANIYELIHACSKAMPHITSTRDLPARIPDFPDDTRSLVILELYTTEYTYVKGLEVLSEVFKDPLSTVLGEECGTIFANVDDILIFNKGFLALLHSRLTNWSKEQCLGDIFIGMFTQSHKSMYAIYCANYDTAEMLVQQRIKRKREFEQQLQLCFTNSRVMPGLTLQAYLITPVQRIPRYILLLKDIIKRTPEDHPDYRNLTKAKERMGELAAYIDAQVRESQTKKTFVSLKNKVHGLADLESPDRKLVKEGQVYLKNIKKLYQCILFNDLLVFALGDSRQSTVELQLNLEAVWVEDLEDLDPQTSNEDAIELYTPERPYTIYTRTNSEKRLWLAKLRETIYYHLYTEDKCLRSDTCSTESRHATFVYADGRTYSGNYVDSKRHGKGTMTWPNKTVYVGDWVDDERCGEGEFTYNTGEIYRGRWVENKQSGMGELQYASNDIYRGHWKDGVRQGDGKILYANGDLFDGHFVAGQIEGHGRLRCTNGVEYDGEFKHSQRHGFGTLKTVQGNVYRGEFRYNQIHGQGCMHYKNGDKYEGTWKNSMQQGQGRFTSKSEGTYEGSWEMDLRHGRGRLVYRNGDIYEGGWELNKRHEEGSLKFSTGEVYVGGFEYDMISGWGKMKYSDVSKYEGDWVNGLKHGMGAMVYEDMSSYNGDWRQGLRHSHGEMVNADGSVYRGMWANDKPHGKGTWHIPTSSYTYSGDFVCGKREGKGEESSQYGKYKGQWRNDAKHGLGEEKSLVGTIFEGTWERNRKHGRGVRKMVIGTVEEQVWKNGQLQSDPTRMTAVELPYIPRNDY